MGQENQRKTPGRSLRGTAMNIAQLRPLAMVLLTHATVKAGRAAEIRRLRTGLCLNLERRRPGSSGFVHRRGNRGSAVAPSRRLLRRQSAARMTARWGPFNLELALSAKPLHRPKQGIGPARRRRLCRGFCRLARASWHPVLRAGFVRHSTERNARDAANHLAGVCAARPNRIPAQGV